MLNLKSDELLWFSPDAVLELQDQDGQPAWATSRFEIRIRLGPFFCPSVNVVKTVWDNNEKRKSWELTDFWDLWGHFWDFNVWNSKVIVSCQKEKVKKIVAKKSMCDKWPGLWGTRVETPLRGSLVPSVDSTSGCAAGPKSWLNMDHDWPMGIVVDV